MCYFPHRSEEGLSMFRHMTLERWTLVAVVLVVTALDWAHPSRVTSTLITLCLFTAIILNRRERGGGWWG